MVPQEAVNPTEVTEEEVEEENVVVEEEQAKLPEDQDTHPTPQMPAVTAISNMARIHGIVWPHSPVHGSTNVLQGPEGQASLEEKRRKLTILITTFCFPK